MKVAIGSKNPVKIAAVQEAFTKVWPEVSFQFVGIDAVSGVSNQPMSDEESINGATNRAKQALTETDADFGVGPKGGLQKVGEMWFDTGWIVIIDKNGRKGIGSTIRLETPKKVMNLIEEGKELGEVCDILFQQENSKQAGGYFGLVTNELISRKAGYTHGVIAALSAFINKDLFSN